MSSITIKAGLKSAGFKTGIQEMRNEWKNFRATFDAKIDKGGGFFGSIDAAIGKLSTGRLAAPFAAIGVALVGARIATEAMSKSWENMASATDRALQNVQAIESARASVSGQKYAGDTLTRDQARELGAKRSAASEAAQQATYGDTSTFAGRRQTAKAMAGEGIGGFWQFLKLTGGAMGVPMLSKGYDAANEEYKRQQSTADATRTAANLAADLSPYNQFANRTQQRSGQGDLQSAVDRLGVAQGRVTGYEAAQRKALLANAQYQDALKTYSNNENDPRVMQAKAAALDAFTAFDTEANQARRFRNDPMISADSLARLGGGGSVGVFGQGKGELLFEQKRLNTSIAGLTQEIRNLNVNLSRGAGGDVRQ
jgi:hypothetical protein